MKLLCEYRQLGQSHIEIAEDLDRPRGEAVDGLFGSEIITLRLRM